MNKKEKLCIVIFTMVTLLAGPFGLLVDSILTDQPEGDSLGMGLWLILPLLTGLILRAFTKQWSTFGIKPHFKGNTRWYLIAIFLFPIITLICITIGLALHGIKFHFNDLDAIPGLLIGGLIGSFVKNIFEEFSWRGNLVPFLEKAKLNDFVLYLVSGTIWGLWHVAYYLVFLPDSYFVQTSRPAMVVYGIIFLICWSPLFVELYRLTTSVWPCVLLHTMEDAVPTLLFVTGALISLDEKYSTALDPITGIVPTALILATGLLLRKHRLETQ